MARIELKNVSKSYGNHEVVWDLDLVIPDGSLTVFVGPSGCGKSTLLRMIAGLEDISAGDVLFDGERANDVSPVRRGVAMVFQNYALYPHLTVRDNIGFGLKMAGAGKDEIRERVDEAADTLHIEPLLDRRPAALSGGQRQRVAIGRAIVRDPTVFLFDEPLSNLDAELRVVMRVEIAKLHQQLRATMIYVTHDQVEAMTLADQIVVLRAGQIEQIGTADELFSEPRNLFVAGFIGSPQMNFLKGRHIGGGNIELAAGGRLHMPGHELADGEPVTVGIRPEHIVTQSETSLVSGRVDVVENLGGVRFAHTTLPSDETMVVESRADVRPKPGDNLSIGFSNRHVHIFRESGEAANRLTESAIGDSFRRVE